MLYCAKQTNNNKCKVWISVSKTNYCESRKVYMVKWLPIQNIWCMENNYIWKELLFKYNEESVNLKKEIIDDLMKELPVNVVMYQLENNYYIYRLDNRKIRALFVNIISKVKRVPNVKIITIPDNLVPNIATTRIMCLTENLKSWNIILYRLDWFQELFCLCQNLSDKKSLKSQIESLSKCKKTSTRNNLLKAFMERFSVICSFFRPVELIVYTSSYINKKNSEDS